MTKAEAVATLKARLEEAERIAERMRTAGTQEQYLEAYFRVTALELQLDRVLNAIRL
jgi:hypothetical protein